VLKQKKVCLNILGRPFLLEEGSICSMSFFLIKDANKWKMLPKSHFGEMGFVSRKARKGAKTQGFFDTNTNLRKCDFFDTKSHAKAQRRHKDLFNKTMLPTLKPLNY